MVTAKNDVPQGSKVVDGTGGTALGREASANKYISI